MANYPLKKIQIGSDTYEIQSGSKSYRVTLEASLNTQQSISGLTVKEILDTYASSVNWSIIDITCLEDGITYDPSLVMIDDLDGMKYYHARYDFYGSGGVHNFGNFINWQPDDEQASNVMFGIGEYGPNAITGLVSVSIDNQTNIVGNMILSNFGGGGGGGSSTTILGLYDPNQGNLVDLNSLSQSMTVEVWDITDMANPVPLDDTAFLAKIQAGQCYFKDSRNNTYSVVYDATANNIGVIFNAAGVPYFVSINYQWNNNWNIMVLKPITLH